MRPCHNPYGGVNPLIDKMIGNAYDIVKYVARYLKEIRYVAENMGTVYDVAHGYRVQLNGNAEGNTSLYLALPGNLNPDNINGLMAVAHYDGNIYVPSPDTFNFGLSGGSEIAISINDSVIPDLIYADFRVTIYTIPPSQNVEPE